MFGKQRKKQEGQHSAAPSGGGRIAADKVGMQVAPRALHCHSQHATKQAV